MDASSLLADSCSGFWVSLSLLVIIIIIIIIVIIRLSLGDITVSTSDSVCCNRCYRAWSVCMCLYVCVSSVTLMHSAEAVGRNEIPFGRHTRVVPSNTLLNRGPSHLRKRETCGRNSAPSSQRCPLSPNYINDISTA